MTNDDPQMIRSTLAVIAALSTLTIGTVCGYKVGCKDTQASVELGDISPLVADRNHDGRLDYTAGQNVFIQLPNGTFEKTRIDSRDAYLFFERQNGGYYTTDGKIMSPDGKSITNIKKAKENKIYF